MLLVGRVQCSCFNYVILFDTGGKPCEHLWWVSEVEGQWRLHFLPALVGASFSTTDTQLRKLDKKGTKAAFYWSCLTNKCGDLWSVLHFWSRVMNLRTPVCVIGAQSHHWVAFKVSLIIEGIRATRLLPLSFNWRQTCEPRLIWLLKWLKSARWLRGKT